MYLHMLIHIIQNIKKKQVVNIQQNFGPKPLCISNQMVYEITDKEWDR